MNEIVGYAIAYVSMLVPEVKGLRIKEIILFGSTAREEHSSESDVDIFINIFDEKEGEKIERITKEVLAKFYKSDIYRKWKLIGISNQIDIRVGILDKWKLKRSVISDGIMLYGKYKQLPEKFDQFSFFTFEPMRDVTKRNRVIRMLFGREEKKYKTQGIMKEYGGKKVSERSFIIPASAVPKIMKILSKERIDYRIYDMWSDQFS